MEKPYYSLIPFRRQFREQSFIYPLIPELLQIKLIVNRFGQSQKKMSPVRSCRNGSAAKVLAMKARGQEFGSPGIK